MTKIALIGYGKMGKTIELVAKERANEIVHIIDVNGSWEGIEQAEVAIEFSTPETAFQNISNCIERGIPVVAGTTGWLEYKSAIEKLVIQHNGTFLYASNFSLGVNLFFELNKQLAQMMAKFTDYSIQMEEIHHTEKKDAPSGTAISLANDVLPILEKSWKLGNSTKDIIGIEAKREDQVPGTHTVTYANEIDSISITHTAFNRKGFALGAVIAAEYIKDKKGLIEMKEVLGI